MDVKADDKVSVDEAIAELYALHQHGRLGDRDERWNEVRRLFRVFAEMVVRERCPPQIFGPLREQAVQDLSDDLLVKFIRKKFNPNGKMLPLLRRVAANDLISTFRRRRSLMCLTGWATENDDDPVEATWRASAPAEHVDMFARIRALLPPFRFLEHQLIREAILVFFLTHQTYPGEKFLHGYGVRPAARAAIYNAAIFDLNRAMKQVCHAN